MTKLELKIPPPIVVIIIALLMYLIDKITPSFSAVTTITITVITIIVSSAILLAIAALITFLRAKTTINPHTPQQSTSLITAGIYSKTRNPMYLALLLFLIAWSIVLSNVFSLLFTIFFVIYLNKFQIQPEEMILEDIFGQEYVEYKAQVGRWL